MTQKIKKSTIFNTLYQRTGFDKDDIAVVEYKQAEIEYNIEGQLVRETHYTEDDEVENITLNEYDTQGRQISSTQYDADDILCQKTTLQYDEENHLICEGNIYGEGSPEYFTRFVFENGLLLRQDSYDEEEFDFTEKAFSYDEHGRVIKEIDYSDDGEELYVIENQYNEEGKLGQLTRHEVAAKDKRTYQFEYDERGNKIKDLIYNYNDELIAKTYYTYNSDNRLVETESEDLNQYQKVTYTYENILLTTEELSDKQGHVLTKTEYTYNAQGDVCSVTRYIRDEVENDVLRQLSLTRYEYEYFD